MGPEALAHVLRPLAGMFGTGEFPDLLRGLESPDDAAVWLLDATRALVLTSDFFPPVVYDPYQYGAIAAANAFAPSDITWFEEPVPPENVDAMREVKRSTRTPICAGENLYLRWGFRDLIEKQAVDVDITPLAERRIDDLALPADPGKYLVAERYIALRHLRALLRVGVFGNVERQRRAVR